MANANKKKTVKVNSVNIRNKRATFDYEVLDTFMAGIVLTGTEIRTVYTMIHLLSAGQFQWFETYSKWHFHCI